MTCKALATQGGMMLEFITTLLFMGCVILYWQLCNAWEDNRDIQEELQHYKDVFGTIRINEYDDD